MTWEQRYRLRMNARTSMVFWAVLALIAALLCAPVVRFVDRETRMVLFGFSAEGARSILSTLAGSMLTFIVFVLSTTLIVVQLASAQLTPRVIAFVLAKTSVKVTVGILTFTYTYTLSALSRVDNQVPDLHVTIAIVLNLICIVVFFQFVHQLSGGLRPASLMLHVAETGRRAIEQVYPSTYDPGKPEQTTRSSPAPTASQTIAFRGQSGAIMAMSTKDLVQLAEKADVMIELIPQVGDLISRGDPLFRVFGSSPNISEDALQGCVAVGTERTVDQDPRFVFRILVDIANKALSPAINDPTTAVIALDHIDHLMLFLGKRSLDEGVARDSHGKLRLIYGTPDWPDYVILATSEIRQFGEGSLQINRRLRALLEHLIKALPPVRRAALETELSMLGSSALRRFLEEEDRKRAGIADHQGVGGSDA